MYVGYFRMGTVATAELKSIRQITEPLLMVIFLESTGLANMTTQSLDCK